MYKPQKLEFVVIDISPENANLLWNDIVHFIEDRGFDVTGDVFEWTDLAQYPESLDDEDWWFDPMMTEDEYKDMLQKQDEINWSDPDVYYSNEDEHDE